VEQNFDDEVLLKMSNLLPFKTSDDALDYVERFFDARPIKPGVSLIGAVRKLKSFNETQVFLIEVNVTSGIFKKSNRREIVAGAKHPELNCEIQVGDLVNWGCDKKQRELSSGFILDKLLPELDLDTGMFKKYVPPIQPSKKLGPEQLNVAVKTGVRFWKRELDLVYGDILKCSEIFSDKNNFYLHYTMNETHDRTIAWNKSTKQWYPLYEYKDLWDLDDRISVVTPKHFEEVVFPSSDEDHSYLNKQKLKEFLFFSIPRYSKKKLSVKTSNGNEIAFELSAIWWNNALIGESFHLTDNVKLILSDGVSKNVQCDIEINDTLITLQVDECEPQEFAQSTLKNLNGYYSTSD